MISLLDPTPLIMNTPHTYTENKGNKHSFTPKLTQLLPYLEARSGGQSVTLGSTADVLHQAMSSVSGRNGGYAIAKSLENSSAGIFRQREDVWESSPHAG